MKFKVSAIANVAYEVVIEADSKEEAIDMASEGPLWEHEYSFDTIEVFAEEAEEAE